MIRETLTLRFENEEQRQRFHALLNSDIAVNLDRAYRALCGYAMAAEGGVKLDAAARAYSRAVSTSRSRVPDPATCAGRAMGSFFSWALSSC